ncbi:MAG: SMP-30/gluconolactonase/LRE family protein [Bryobacteraceae bacterium]|nr:SMP-30/gluconolactonase/LRE family protein [Bryobacteraceae bacterium]MDW8378226.1 SMP-30/gluconolactonase/LRE family protein [Bryobacterales bacterium]
MMVEAKSDQLWKFIDKSAQLRQVAVGYGFTAGPVFSRLGYLLFCDVANQRILKWERGTASVFRNFTNRARGLSFDHQGRLLVAEGGGRVTRTEKSGAITVLAGENVKGPADLVYAIDGSIYFSDPPSSAVFQITPARSGVGGAPPRGEVRLVAEVASPSGVALSPTQQQLYIADQKSELVRVCEVLADGRLSRARDFAPALADGLKTDEAGNVWMATRQGVEIYSSRGEYLGRILTPEPSSNCCWGEGFRGLYVTAGHSVYHLPTLVSGTRTF